MTRVKSGMVTRRRHKKVLKFAKGYWMSRHKQFKKAKEAVLHSGSYALAGRKNKKRDFRTLWIIRLSAALRKYDLTYSKFIYILKNKKINLDRKILSKVAVEYPQVFEKLLHQIKTE